MSLKCHVPHNVNSLLEIVPEKERPENPAVFYQAVAEECLLLMVARCRRHRSSEPRSIQTSLVGS